MFSRQRARFAHIDQTLAQVGGYGSKTTNRRRSGRLRSSTLQLEMGTAASAESATSRHAEPRLRMPLRNGPSKLSFGRQMAPMGVTTEFASLELRPKGRRRVR